VRIAVAQPHVGADRSGLLDDAVALAAQAAAAGARLLLFPEAYPGPMHVDDPRTDTAAALAAAAREHGIWLAWGALEPGEGGWQVVHHVTAPDGAMPVRYPRAHPATGDVHPVLNGTDVVAGQALATFDCEGVTVGLLVCSELWLPEVARVLALRGAQLILAPAGGGFTRVAGNWELLARARAVENHAYVALTVSRFGDEAGSALIAGPEELVADGPYAELVVGDLDLDRVAWLRDHDDSMAEPKAFSALPGLLRARRPALYSEVSR
jgi:predicted amidohydrolase